MKKLITVAAVASVALASDFLGHHKPVAVVKDGLNIVKDVKSHSYGKLIKDGVKLHKDLKLEDQELFFDIPTDPQDKLKLARETVRKMEILVKQYEAGIPIIKVKDPKGYPEFLAAYERAKEQLVFARQGLELIEMLLGVPATGGNTKSRKLQAGDNEFFAQDEVEAQLREMRACLALVEKTIQEFEKEGPAMKNAYPAAHAQISGEMNKQKQMLAQAKKELEELEALVKGKTKFQPMRKLFAEDNEFIAFNETEDQIRDMKEKVAIAEAEFLEYEQVHKRWMEACYPETYPQWLEKIQIEKEEFAKAKRQIAEMENSLKNSMKSTKDVTKFRKSRADDDELFNLGDLLKEGKKIREEIKHH